MQKDMPTFGCTLPASQGTHCADASFDEYVPTLQFVQAVEAMLEEKVPVGQALQALIPAASA